MKTLPQLLDEQAAVRKDHPALVLPEKTYTYTEFRDRANLIAKGLMALGVNHGDRVGYFFLDCPDSLPVLYGILKTGAIAVPVNNRFKSYELGKVLAQCGLSVLFTSPPRSDDATDLVKLLKEVLPELPALKTVISIDPLNDEGFLSWQSFCDGAADISAEVLKERQTSINIKDTAVIKYTSGTTGAPKGAMLSHGAIFNAAEGSAAVHLKLTESDRVWTALPLFHIGGVAFGTACISVGCIFIHPGYFDPGVSVEQIIEHKITVAMPAFETIWLPVVDHPRWCDVDLTTLRMVEAVGTEARLLDIQSRHPDAVVVSCFGMTEACGFLSLALPSDPVDTRINTGGHPLPGMEARICDPETGQVLPPGGIGEICFKGPNTFDGYYLEPELTASCFDDEGYFKTGDLGHMDEDGRVTYRNRIKDMLKVGGENVAAAEVEDYLIGHPAVLIAQVVAAPDAKYVEVPAAFLQLKPDQTTTETEIIEFCRGNIATFRVPRYVRFVDEWPMSGTKIKKFELRQRIADEIAASGKTEAENIGSS